MTENARPAPKVSVLVPIYKTDPDILRETIRSVLAQTFRDFELVLVDDCPEEPREAVVRAFDDVRIRYERNERNLGISPTRNLLLDRARGEYLAVLDHDDVCRADRFEKEAAWLDAHPACGVVSSWTREMPSGRITPRATDDETIRLHLMFECPVAHSASMIRASVLKEHGIRYEEAFSPSEDYRLWLRLMPHTEFHVIPEPLLDYRLYEGNTTKRQWDRMRRVTVLAQEDAYREMPALRAASLRLSRRVAFVRVFGLPILRIERTDGLVRVKLFGVLPFMTIRTKTKPILTK